MSFSFQVTDHVKDAEEQRLPTNSWIGWKNRLRMKDSQASRYARILQENLKSGRTEFR